MSPRALDQPIPFGQRYWLTALLAVGGMAEIYQARQRAMAGFEKHVVIKRLRPELTQDPALVEMFLDEARICAVLDHPNVVHVYDVDIHQGIPYIAMELIRGQELNTLCRRGLTAGHFLPLAHALELMRQAAAGLAHVHTRRGMDGAPLAIVHCDISPSNLLVTEDGFLEIIDFGIARARNQTFRDHASVPGKLSYMSPEQASRSAIDHRSDIFSLGVVLYEITVGRRLFKGPSAEVIDRLLMCDIAPPTRVRPDFPVALEEIIMRALARYPSERFQSAYDLADQLEGFARAAGLRSGPVRIARYLDELTVAEGGQRRPELIPELIPEIEPQVLDEDDLELEREGALELDELLLEEPGDDPDRIAATMPRARTSQMGWDELEEPDGDAAAVLGMDPDIFQRAFTPVPLDGDALGQDDPTPVRRS